MKVFFMENLTKLDFVPLDISGRNYLSWILDVEIHLDVKGLGDTIKHNNEASSQNKTKAMIFLRHHLHEGLKFEYLMIRDLLTLWKNLKERYDHQKTVILPNAQYEWLHLRLQDFKSVSEYNSAMFKITSKLKLCGEKIPDNDMCGMKEHLSHTYRTSKHLVDLYQASLKEKEKNIEANFAYQDDDLLNESLDFTNLDVADDLINGNMNISTGNEKVHN
ncbi:uncharacterized protein LOC133833075 [Humulus lupulus]|uniref:uncharacterized protein LOC133833075 n=1 Tax=Humulus lupulus TaxID=3486 RepID=UPI002B404ADB|nr:uncharacterized protein LOC133833075 [Humulus lupulus]